MGEISVSAASIGLSGWKGIHPVVTRCPYNLFLAVEFISERENQSLHAKELNAKHESKIYKETIKFMFVYKDKEDTDDITSESDEDLPLQFNPH